MLNAVLQRVETGMLTVFKEKKNVIAITLLLQAFFIVTINIHVYKLGSISLKDFFLNINLVLLLTGLAIVSIKEIEEMNRKKTEAKLMKKHLEQVEGLVKTLQSQKHEHSRHLQILQAMLYLEEFNKAVEYIEGLAENSLMVGEGMLLLGHPALSALLNSRKKYAEEKAIDFAFSFKCDLTEINIKPWDLCSLAGNLLDNAFEAVLLNRGKKQVALEIKKEKGFYVIYVYNNGPLIAPEEREKIFAPGYTTKDSLARGYGLYLLQKMVEGYEGKIEVVSAEKTTFTVYLPCAR